METLEEAFLVLMVAPRRRCGCWVWHFSVGIYIGVGDVIKAGLFFHIDTISAEPKMFTFLTICNFLPTLNEVNN